MEISSVPHVLAAIGRYYEVRGLKVPTAVEAILWADTEIAEAKELILADIGGWTRNNPDAKEPYTLEGFGEELGDAIMMLMMAGRARGIDPMLSMLAKIERKLDEHVQRRAAKDEVKGK